MAKKAQAGQAEETDERGGGTLGDIAESLGTVLGNAEKQWRAWQGPRDAVVQAVTDVRDRAAALLSEMGVTNLTSNEGGKAKKSKKAKAANAADAGDGQKKKKKKGKKNGKKGKNRENGQP